VDDLPAGVVRASGVLQGGLGAFREGAVRRGVLARSPAQARSGGCEPKPRVARFASQRRFDGLSFHSLPSR